MRRQRLDVIENRKIYEAEEHAWVTWDQENGDGLDMIITEHGIRIYARASPPVGYGDISWQELERMRERLN